MHSARRPLRRAGFAAALALLALAASAEAAVAPLTLTLVLAPRDPAGLAALATAVATPGSPQYHRYLSVREFAGRFGASAAGVAAARNMLRAAGVTPGALAANGLSLSASGSAASVSRAFSVALRRYRGRTGHELFANAAPPRVPAALARIVTAVLGLSDLPAAAPASLVRGTVARRGARAAALAPAIGSAPAPCTAAIGERSATGAHTIDQIAGAYRISPLYSSADFGSGVTIALYELEPYTSSDVTAFQSCFGTHATVTNVAVDGGPGSGATQSGETQLDLDNVIGVAPSSAVEVYQGPNSGSGPYDVFSRIVTDNSAQVVSDSWGLCEQLSDQSVMSAENVLFQEAATQGQSILVAAGDSGSSGCLPADPMATGLAVDDAASQPFVTGVGGTELSALGPPSVESVWSDSGAGSGGGISSVWAMPAYQALSGAPGVVNSFTSATPCKASAGSYCREVPDVSADAAPSTGYVVYDGGSWRAFGGTSAAAPVWAGLTALADASGLGGCSTSTPLGFINPLLYAIAAGTNGSAAFTDVTTGNNSITSSAAYPATTGYDMASGLGTPVATGAGAAPGLVAQLCGAGAGSPNPPSVTAVVPADAAAGATVAINGSGFAPGATVSFGTTAASTVAFVSANQLTATVPAGSGVVDVTVTTSHGTSTTVAADRFTYGPTESIATPVAGGIYTQGQQVLAAYSCTASIMPAPVCTGPVAAGTAIDTAAPGAHSFTVTATDANQVSTHQSVSYMVVAPPAATISTPGSGTAYTEGESVAAAYSCSSAAPGSVGCAGTVPPGAPLDTSLGTHSFSVTATDADGVSVTQTISYSVVAQPSVAITVPRSGQILVRGATAVAQYACTTTAPVTITGCTGTIAAGSALPTGSLGTHTMRVSATDSNGITTQRTVTYTVIAPRPTVTAFAQTASSWAERGAPHGRPPVGTRFSVSVDQSSTITLRFTRIAAGSLTGTRCVATTARNRGARSCTRLLDAGTVTLHTQRGAVSVRFVGSTSRGMLAPGTYTVTVSAVGIAGVQSATRTLRFVVAATA